MAGTGPGVMPPAWQQIIQGLTNVLQIGGVTVTFPSAKFCKNYVDSEFLTKVQSIALAGQKVVGGVKIGGMRVCHEHIRGNTGVAYVWNTATALSIIATGEKGNGTPKDSGGYHWTTK